jgi:hypothetical protein
MNKPRREYTRESSEQFHDEYKHKDQDSGYGRQFEYKRNQNIPASHRPLAQFPHRPISHETKDKHRPKDYRYQDTQYYETIHEIVFYPGLRLLLHCSSAIRNK